jgi:hypothetical protein
MVPKATPVHLGVVDNIPFTREEQIDVNAQGGKQSHVDQAFHRLDPVAMLTLIEVLGYGDKKYNEESCAIGDENWRKLNHLDHINHAGIHLFKYLRELQFGPQPNDPEATQHLGHAFCRIMFALGSAQGARKNIVQARDALTGKFFEVDLDDVSMVERVDDTRARLFLTSISRSIEVMGSQEYWLSRKNP